MNKNILIVVIGLLLVIATEGTAEQRVVIEINGMSCKLCPLAIKKSLMKTEGVVKANVSLEQQRARLIVKDTVSDESIMNALKKAGPYEGRIIEKHLIDDSN